MNVHPVVAGLGVAVVSFGLAAPFAWWAGRRYGLRLAWALVATATLAVLFGVLLASTMTFEIAAKRW